MLYYFVRAYIHFQKRNSRNATILLVKWILTKDSNIHLPFSDWLLWIILFLFILKRLSFLFWNLTVYFSFVTATFESDKVRALAWSKVYSAGFERPETLQAFLLGSVQRLWCPYHVSTIIHLFFLDSVWTIKGLYILCSTPISYN